MVGVITEEWRRGGGVGGAKEGGVTSGILLQTANTFPSSFLSFLPQGQAIICRCGEVAACGGGEVFICTYIYTFRRRNFKKKINPKYKQKIMTKMQINDIS